MKKILKIKINDTPFFENGLELSFSENLNCLMGGRGTGKTTLLYFILTSLIPESENETLPFSILKNNLGDGTIEFEFESADGRKFKSIKYFGEEPQFYELPGNNLIEFEQIKPELGCDIYEAMAIEEIGRNEESRLDIIDKMLPEEVNNYQGEIGELKIDLMNNAKDVKTILERIKLKSSEFENIKHIKKEFNDYKKSKPKDMDKDEENKFKEEDENEKRRSRETTLVKKIITQLKTIKVKTDELLEENEEFIDSNIKLEQNYQNKEIMDACIKNFVEVYEKLKKQCEELSILISSNKDKIENQNEELKKKHTAQKEIFNKLKEAIEKNKKYYLRYNDLSKKDENRKNLEKEIKELNEKKEKLLKARNSLLQSYNDKKQELFNLRLKSIEKLNKLFADNIRITLTFGGITQEYEKSLRNALKGSGLRYNELIPRIIAGFSPDTFAKIIHEKDVETLKNITGIDKVRSQQLIDALFDKDDIYEIEAIYSPDLPDFHLKVEPEKEFTEQNYKKSDDLSTGQRCTTVLPIVFAVSNNPLIIDQPEDNLDNKYITEEIYKIIEKLKENRQLIFITHNPNIPVLPDAELNIFLNYDKKANIIKMGTVSDVKELILDRLEGGEAAFLRRKKIYGLKDE